jgi:hypothetical protein
VTLIRGTPLSLLVAGCLLEDSKGCFREIAPFLILLLF